MFVRYSTLSAIEKTSLVKELLKGGGYTTNQVTNWLTTNNPYIEVTNQRLQLPSFYLEIINN